MIDIKFQVRNSGYSVPIRPSRWVYDKFKDDVHFYLAIMGIPLGAAITLTNLFYSNPELSAIPEGYTPKEWEYFPNPITRFITRYFKTGFQECYEVHLHCIWEAAKVSEMRQLKKEVKRKKERKGRELLLKEWRSILGASSRGLPRRRKVLKKKW